jgi:BASS family bile acid:Na+ symporter
MAPAKLVPLLLLASLFLVVFAAGLNATVRDATYALRRPARLARMLAAMYLVMPALAIAAALAFDLKPAVKLALVALALSPVPALMPGQALKAGSAGDYMALLVAASLLAVPLVPLGTALCAYLFAVPLTVPAGQVALQMFAGVLLPFALGMLVRRVAPALAERIAKPAGLCATVLLVAGAAGPAVEAWRGFPALVGGGTLLALAAFTLAGLAAGHLLGGPRDEDRTLLALATATRHPGVAITLAHATAPDATLPTAAVIVYLILGALFWFPYARWTHRHGAALKHSA